MMSSPGVRVQAEGQASLDQAQAMRDLLDKLMSRSGVWDTRSKGVAGGSAGFQTTQPWQEDTLLNVQVPPLAMDAHGLSSHSPIGARGESAKRNDIHKRLKRRKAETRHMRRVNKALSKIVGVNKNPAKGSSTNLTRECRPEELRETLIQFDRPGNGVATTVTQKGDGQTHGNVKKNRPGKNARQRKKKRASLQNDKSSKLAGLVGSGVHGMADSKGSVVLEQTAHKQPDQPKVQDVATITTGGSQTQTVRKEPPKPNCSSTPGYIQHNPQPLHKAPPFCSMPAMNTPMLRPAWADWRKIVFHFHELPPDTSTADLYLSLQDEGVEGFINYMDIYQVGNETKAKVIFKPPPPRQAWSGRFQLRCKDQQKVPVRVTIDTRPELQISTLRSKAQKFEAAPEMELDIDQLDFGVLLSPKCMLVLKSLGHQTGGKTVAFRVDRDRRHLDVHFKAWSSFTPGPKGQSNSDIARHIRFQIKFSQLSRLIQVNLEDGKKSLVIPLENPPEFYEKASADKVVEWTHSPAQKTWREWDTWFRQTNISDDPRVLARLPANLKRSDALVNLGRWTTYRVVLSQTQRNPGNFIEFQRILQHHNVTIFSDQDFSFGMHRVQPVWHLIDNVEAASKYSTLYDLSSSTVNMPFEVRYLLEVCISQGKLSEYNLDGAFISHLLEMREPTAVHLLEHVANLRERVFDPMDIFKLIVSKSILSKSRIPSYCCLIKSARITPTTIYYSPASVEVSNRVIRRYSEFSDRFLRVKFTDETHIGQIYAPNDQTSDFIFTRVFQAMQNGIQIGDRKYEFLAFGNSQIREQGAYFFAGNDIVNASQIRAWMGEFQHIDVVAKYAARLGQCFSTTWAVSSGSVEIKYIEDVERQDLQGNTHVFTDGVGKISRFLASIATAGLRSLRNDADPPSLYQFRLGGCKGILAVDPALPRNEIHIRPSQSKFPTSSQGLEIISWSQYAPAHLNRQIILVLSALGVQDEVFMRKLKDNLISLDEAIKNPVVASRELQRIIDPNHETLNLAMMVHAGFQESREPFVTSLLQLWRAWRVKYIKEKANIALPRSAQLFGCVDETATLRGHYDHLQVGSNASKGAMMSALPEVFVQVSSPEHQDGFEIVQGVCLLARNPSLHPGDIRVVKAVDCPNLYHLRNVVVFPQTGDRDLAGMCSGGDLDGDDFLVIWDNDLTPKEWNHSPMDYTPPEPIRSRGEVTIRDVVSFFVRYMKNNRLPRIAHAHLAWADRLPEGVKSDKCIQLAALHSKAVDYNKTGVEAVMSRDQNPYCWPHFMEKKCKPSKVYHSKKVLGQLYDHVQRVDFTPNYSEPFDEVLLNAHVPNESLMTFAKELKTEYDQEMRQIMSQFAVKTEFEIWSTFLLAWQWGPNEYKMHEITGRLASSLKDRFRQACIDHVGGKDLFKLAPLAIAAYKVTHEEMEAALRECRSLERQEDGGGELAPVRDMGVESMPLISFPWVLSKELIKIRCGEYTVGEHVAEPVKHDHDDHHHHHWSRAADEGSAVEHDTTTTHHAQGTKTRRRASHSSHSVVDVRDEMLSATTTGLPSSSFESNLSSSNDSWVKVMAIPPRHKSVIDFESPDKLLQQMGLQKEGLVPPLAAAAAADDDPPFVRQSRPGSPVIIHTPGSEDTPVSPRKAADQGKQQQQQQQPQPVLGGGDAHLQQGGADLDVSPLALDETVDFDEDEPVDLATLGACDTGPDPTDFLARMYANDAMETE